MVQWGVGTYSELSCMENTPALPLPKSPCHLRPSASHPRQKLQGHRIVQLLPTRAPGSKHLGAQIQQGKVGSLTPGLGLPGTPGP